MREIFSEYGNIIDLVAKRNLKAKGQAFIVFDSVDAAKSAVEDIQGFELFEKPMSLDFAKTQSDATVQKEAPGEEFEAHRRRRLAEKGWNFPHGFLRFHAEATSQSGSKLPKLQIKLENSSDLQQMQRPAPLGRSSHREVQA